MKKSYACKGRICTNSSWIDGSRLFLYDLFPGESRRTHVCEGVALTKRFHIKEEVKASLTTLVLEGVDLKIQGEGS